MTTPLDALSGLLDTAPTTRREFRAIDDVSAFARVYQTASQQPKAVTAVFRVLDGDLREISSTQIHLTAEQFTTAGSASAKFRLPLDTLKLHQSFMRDSDRRFKVDIHMEGPFSEHEEETGRLQLHDHPMCAGLDYRDVVETPFRELWMREGTQTFQTLETL